MRDALAELRGLFVSYRANDDWDPKLWDAICAASDAVMTMSRAAHRHEDHPRVAELFDRHAESLAEAVVDAVKGHTVD